jgi:hypothetical protein
MEWNVMLLDHADSPNQPTTCKGQPACMIDNNVLST